MPRWRMDHWRPGFARNPFMCFFYVFFSKIPRVTNHRNGLELSQAYRELIVLWITRRIMRWTVFMCMFSIDNNDTYVLSLDLYLSRVMLIYVRNIPQLVFAAIQPASNRPATWISTVLRNQKGDTYVFERFDLFISFMNFTFVFNERKIA